MKVGKYYLIALGVIIVDQIIKLTVHFNMEMGVIGQKHVIGDVFKIYYILNPGMAFGATPGGGGGKIFLTIFRIIACGGIAYYIHRLYKQKYSKGLLIVGGFILGGALGNVVDSTFYGILLNNAPATAPYPLFHGQVIDMFYLDICDCLMPNWVPIIGGTALNLWPIFNFADASIFVSVIILLLWQKKLLKKPEPNL
jgi:signal peptidase II